MSEKIPLSWIEFTDLAENGAVIRVYPETHFLDVLAQGEKACISVLKLIEEGIVETLEVISSYNMRETEDMVKADMLWLIAESIYNHTFTHNNGSQVDIIYISIPKD